MQPKTILIVTSEFPPQPGGIGTHAYHLALFLSKEGYAVTVIADQREAVLASELDFDQELPFVVRRVRLKRPRWLMYVDRVFKTLTSLKSTDCVIATGKFSLWNVALCNAFFGKPSMAVLHGTEVNYKSFWLKRSIDVSLKQFQTLVAVSNYTKQLVSHLQKPVAVIPNGIVVEAWTDLASEGNALVGCPKLITVGRVSSRKGQLQVIQLLPILTQQFPELHYHCVGIPTEATIFLQEAKRLGVDAHVTFHGALPEPDLKHMLASSDVFVMLSTETSTGDVEGFGIAILEANAVGLPSIGAKGSGIEDAIKEGVSGFLIDSTDAHAFGQALQALLKDHEVYASQAREWAQQHAWRSIVKSYVALLSFSKITLSKSQ